jgi:hypothetical protein
MKATPRSKRFACVLLLCLAVVAYFIYPFVVQYSLISTMREWGRLAAVPDSARNFQIKETGSMFTRGIRAEFTAPMADIERWLDESPGTHGLKPTQIEPEEAEETDPHVEPRKRKYSISPGGGALHAEVIVDDANGDVKIYVYWS